MTVGSSEVGQPFPAECIVAGCSDGRATSFIQGDVTGQHIFGVCQYHRAEETAVSTRFASLWAEYAKRYDRPGAWPAKTLFARSADMARICMGAQDWVFCQVAKVGAWSAYQIFDFNEAKMPQAFPARTPALPSYSQAFDTIKKELFKTKTSFDIKMDADVPFTWAPAPPQPAKYLPPEEFWRTTISTRQYKRLPDNAIEVHGVIYFPDGIWDGVVGNPERFDALAAAFKQLPSWMFT